MDRRFICEDCGTKWFIHEHRVSEPDLTECGRCGGPLVRFANGSSYDGHGSRSGEGADEFGDDR
jgi:predicted nucleic acid-binding Zn ribbon protein